MSTDNVFAALVKEYMEELGISESTAERAVEMFFSVLVDYLEVDQDLNDACQKTFQKKIQDAFVEGEEWATEMFRKLIAKDKIN